jgi:hypothetical protein
LEERERRIPEGVEDIQHRDGKRSYLKDSAEMLDKYLKDRKKAGDDTGDTGYQTIVYKDFARMNRKLDEDYNLDGYKDPDWFEVLKKNNRNSPHKFDNLLIKQEKHFFDRHGNLNDPNYKGPRRRPPPPTADTVEANAGGDETKGGKFEQAYSKGKGEKGGKGKK